MKPHHEINERILREIDQLDTHKDVKEFLKEILSFELDVVDEGRPRFTEQYNEIFNKVFSEKGKNE